MNQLDGYYSLIPDKLPYFLFGFSSTTVVLSSLRCLTEYEYKYLQGAM